MVAVASEGGTHVGPGYRVSWTGLAGATLTSDYVAVAVFAHLTSTPALIYGTRYCNGLAADDLLLGFDDQVFPVNIPIITGFAAPAGLVDIVLSHYSSTFTLIETGTVVSQAWDPTGFAWVLPWVYYRNLPTYTPPALFTILAAVQKNLPTLP